MVTRVSKLGRKRQKPQFFSQLDSALESIRQGVPPLKLRGVQLQLSYLHFAQGWYARGTDAVWHVHHQHQMQYIFSGEFEFRTEGWCERFGEGQGMVLPRNVMHQWRCCDDGIMMGFYLNSQGVRQQGFDQFLARDGREVLRFDDRECEDYMMQVLNMAQEDGPWAAERAGALLFVWLSRALAMACDLSQWQLEARHLKASSSKSDKLCHQAHTFMKNNIKQSLKIEDVALEVGLSSRHLNRLFLQHYGDTVAAMLMKLRLEKARELLGAAPSMPIKTIAYQTGFSTPSYFTQCYKKYFRCLPSDSQGD